MKLDIDVKKTFHLTLTEEEMRGLMWILGNLTESDFNKLCISNEVKTSLRKLYSEWCRND